MAGSTGLEPATSGVTGRRSNQLNYDPAWVRESEKFEVESVKARSRTFYFLLSTFSFFGGRYRDRTCDSRRVKPVLYR